MTIQQLREQSGFAMLLELILVAGVLTLVGIALYESNHHVADTVNSVANRPTAVTASGAADAAVKVVQDDATSEAAASSGVETSADQLGATDTDVTNLGDSFNENNF